MVEKIETSKKTSDLLNLENDLLKMKNKKTTLILGVDFENKSDIDRWKKFLEDHCSYCNISISLYKNDEVGRQIVGIVITNNCKTIYFKEMEKEFFQDIRSQNGSYYATIYGNFNEKRLYDKIEIDFDLIISDYGVVSHFIAEAENDMISIPLNFDGMKKSYVSGCIKKKILKRIIGLMKKTGKIILECPLPTLFISQYIGTTKFTYQRYIFDESIISLTDYTRGGKELRDVKFDDWSKKMLEESEKKIGKMKFVKTVEIEKYNKNFPIPSYPKENKFSTELENANFWILEIARYE